MIRRRRWVLAAAFWAAAGLTLPASASFQQPQTPQNDPAQTQEQTDKDKKDKKKDTKDSKKTQGQPQGQGQGQGQPQQNQGQGQAQPSKPATQPGSKPAPLFGGSLNLKSSRQSKDVATLGFNGLDPNGQVQKGFLTAAATGADTARAQQVTRTTVNQEELTAFLQEGSLNPQAAAARAEGR